MLKIEKTVLPSPEQWEIIIEGMRNPKNSWDRMDSGDGCINGRCGSCGFNPNWCGCTPRTIIGENDHHLMDQLNEGGPVHAKYRRMINVYVTLTAPLYWWKEFDTYKIGTVCNSCSTMHKIHAKEFTLEDFSCEHLFNIDEQDIPDEDLFIATSYDAYSSSAREWSHLVDECWDSIELLKTTIQALNLYRERFLETKDKNYWWQLIQLLPTSYNQKRTIMLNYEVLVGIYKWRRNHKLDEWHTFCDWIEGLPYSELITGRQTEDAVGGHGDNGE